MSEATKERPGLSPDAPDAIQKAADGDKISPAEERSALEYLLGPQRAPRYEAKVTFSTDAGDVELLWGLKALPGEQIIRIERRNTKVNAEDPLDSVDDLQMAAELVAEATTHIRDKSGRETRPADEDFRRRPNGELVPTDVEALRQRFYFQTGILTALAAQVRRISGWGPDRVGTAQRVLVDAVGE